MKMSAFFQFILGFILGVAILAVGATGLAFLFFGRMASSPPKPVFSEEKQEEKKVAENKESSTSDQQPSDQAEKAGEESEEKESAKVEEEKEEQLEEKEEELPPGAYKARVTWSQGLSLRAEPTLEAERIGGVGYNSELIILQDSSDRKWQKVRIANSAQEGWVKAGNVKKVEEGEDVEEVEEEEN